MDSNPLIQKTIIHVGNDYKKIMPGTRVKFHFITRKCDDNQTVIDNSRTMDRPMELIIGKKFKLEVWETIVQAMAINEVASFVVDKSLVHAYPLVSRTLRDAQHPEKPRSRHCCGHMIQSYGLKHEDLNSLLTNPCDLEFIIELLQVENAGEYVQETWQLNETERLSAIPKLREEGNVFFKNGNYTEAVKKYSRAIGFLDQLMISEKPGDSEWKSLQEQKMAILLNFAQCKLVLKEYYEVIEHCTTVLNYDPGNAKALYRRAKAYTSTWNVSGAKADLEALAKYDPSMNNYVQQQLLLLSKMEKEKDGVLKENIKGKLFK
ncbi:aryl-hydrocarbon-interacting protein-like 1 [Halyomorpha halys]|uniref:aryl-hydrocarbon-interacting protein-like 1 n=1 Tax=Halyomorpha halys TaxID=286706 RepID=UPI0006D4D73B|nr:aryl-hydrocarbon-interacting protein-like 1 [Halyomorpha halys]